MQEPLDSRIDRYLLGRMSEDEKTGFENEMSMHPAMAEEVSLQKELMSAVRYARRKELKHRLASAIVEEARQEKKKRLGLRMPGYAWAAVSVIFVLCIFAAVLVIQTGKQAKKANPLKKETTLRKPTLKVLVQVDSSAKINDTGYTAPYVEKNKTPIVKKSKTRATTIDHATEEMPESNDISWDKDTTISIPTFLLAGNTLVKMETPARNSLHSSSESNAIRITVRFTGLGRSSSPCYTWKDNVLTILDMQPKAFRRVIRVMENNIERTCLITARKAYYIHPTAEYCTNFEPVEDQALLNSLGL